MKNKRPGRESKMTSSIPACESGPNRKHARKFALLALLFIMLGAIPVTISLVIKSRLLLLLTTFILLWGIPLSTALLIEKRGLRSLGLSFERKNIATYLFYFLAGTLALFLIHAIETFLLMTWAHVPRQDMAGYSNLLLGVAIQLVFVAVPEEVFHRGFIQSRLCAWLGDVRGWLIGSLIFGFVHVFSRLIARGAAYGLPAAIIGVGTFLAGLLYGFQYLRTRSVVPSALTHIMANLILPPIILMVIGLIKPGLK